MTHVRTNIPPVIRTSEPSSFAHNTLKVRVPGILDETLALNNFPVEITTAIVDLRHEITAGTVLGLQEEAVDRWFWDPAVQPQVGRSWLDLPWYFAEAYAYRRLLEATGYFQPGRWQGFDPFAAKKATEWQPDAAPRAVDRMLNRLPQDPRSRFLALLHASLWGNRADLSYEISARLAREDRDSSADQLDLLLVNDAQAVWEHLAFPDLGHPAPLSDPPGVYPDGVVPRITLIADNAGTELLMDLALVDHMLNSGLTSQVDLHLKPQPFFVSDAMARDVASGLQALAKGSPQTQLLAQRLWFALDAGQLQLQTHWFYASSRHFFELPDDLYQRLSAAHLVIVKGDANYRRLLGDAHWPFTASFTEAVGDFPAPMVALRTLKAELMVGLQPGRSEALRAEDPAWLVNGRRGVIQAMLGR
jgi:hypothetical protein